MYYYNTSSGDGTEVERGFTVGGKGVSDIGAEVDLYQHQ
jgi:hypothetical protein